MMKRIACLSMRRFIGGERCVVAVVALISIALCASCAPRLGYPNVYEWPNWINQSVYEEIDRSVVCRQVPCGEYVAVGGCEKMIVEDARIRIVREKSTLYELPNVINQSAYDKDDIAESRPQRFVVINGEMIEWIRMEVPPTPEYKIVFRKTK